MGSTGLLGGLLGAVRARFVFVVGKGGVGKTTTAGALALGLADAGATTRLLSTDPAHSLGDLFGRALRPGVAEASGCADRLTLEELDTGGAAERWLADAGPAVAELIDLGTWLEREDVDALLERTFPGMDEIMAALRLAELAGDADVDRIVVDTAPTGHTLRLLEAGEVLDGWAHALAAMAAKASAVASPFAGHPVRFAGERVVRELRAGVERFATDVLARAEFVVVTREGEVVRAETARLVGALGARGLAPAVLVGVGADPEPGLGGCVRITVPLLRDPSGCRALRAWGGAGLRVAEAAPAVPADAPARIHRPGAALDALRGRELLLFAGKGGVGKSTCAAACAAALSAERRVRLLGTDPAGSLGEVLGASVGPEGARLGARLVAHELDAHTRLEEFRVRYRSRVEDVFRRLGLHASADLDRRVLESVIGLSPPGMDEVFALQALLEDPGEHEVIVLDSAPTGHFLRLIAMPGQALEWTRALLRLILKYRAVFGLDDFAAEVLQLARHLKTIVQLFQDPARTGVVVVTLSETLPRLETERLVARLGLEAIPLLAVIENRHDAASPRTPRIGTRPEGTSPHRILAPLLHPSPTGPDALVDFAARWTLE